MKVISKRISRNEFVSRKDGVIPSLVDMWIIPDTLLNCGGSASYVFGTYESAAAKMRELGLSPSLLEYKADFVYQDHNYGLVVSDVIIPDNIKVTDYTDIYVNIPNGRGGYYDLNDPNSLYHYEGRKIMRGEKEVKVLTYKTLNKWYTFFKDYYGTIKMYSNAISLYEAEYPVKNEPNRKRYSDLDDLFNARGGKQMYDWIIENCMPHDKGENVKDDFEYETGSASYVIPLMITTSIDDLGEMTIFSTKWKGGVDYHNRVGSGLGTVVDSPYSKDNDGNVTYDYETYVINGNKKGYKHNEYYENEFAPEDWENYTDWFVKNNGKRFASYDEDGNCVETYAYSPVNGQILYNTSEECRTVDYTERDFILIEGEFEDVVDGDYVDAKLTGDCIADISLRRGIKLPVLKDGPLKYAELNDRRFYASKDDGVEKIYFIRGGICCDPGSPILHSKYVIHGGNLFTFTGNHVSITNEGGVTHTYQVANGYFFHNGAIFYVSEINGVKEVCLPYIENESVSFRTLTEEEKSKLGWESVSVSDNKINICYKLDVKYANKITGYTDSKLDLLRRRKINTDEMGTELPGYLNYDISSELAGYSIYEAEKSVPIECKDGIIVQFGVDDVLKIEGYTYNTPYDQCTLDILYEVGQVSDLEFQKEVNGVKLYNGNYLESIEFYHLDDGKKVDVERVTGKDSRSTIKKYLDEGGEYYSPTKMLYCDITYYIGATLEYDEENSRYIPSKGRHKGVKYIDTLTVTKSTGKYFMSDGTFFNFTYYHLIGNNADWRLEDYRDNKLINTSYFEMDTMLFCNTDRCEPNDNRFCIDYWENNNGMITSPVFRTEYNLFSSTPQKSKSDIYIDRGISAAFEKNIKLQEIHTLDDLVKYGNGYFKINKY